MLEKMQRNGSLRHCCWERKMVGHSGNKFGNFYTTKYAIYPMTPSYTLGHLLQKNEKVCSHKKLYVNIQRSFTHNRPKLEATQMPFCR